MIKTSLFEKLIGLLLLIIPFIPLLSIFGDIQGIKNPISPSFWLLSFIALPLLSWVICYLLPEVFFKLIKKSINFIINTNDFLKLFVVLSLLFLVLSKIDTEVFKSAPSLVDSVVQLFQAQIFANGSLTTNEPSYSGFFVTQHTIFDNGKWYAQYPPLHSLFLSLGLILNQVNYVSITMSLITVLSMYYFVKNEFGKSEAHLTVLLFCFSPFFLFMGSSFMNHVSSLMLLSLFLLFFHTWLKKNNLFALFLAVLFGSSIALVRPLNAIALLLPFTIPGVRKLIELKQPKQWLIAVGTLSSVVLALLFYNLKTTGEALLFGYIKLWGSGHGLGFHESPWGKAHTPLSGLRNELADLQLLQEFLFEWPIPSLLPLVIFLIYSGKVTSSMKRLLLGAMLVPCAYFFYWYRDAFLGPRFMYDSIGFLIPLTSIAIVWMFKLLDNHFLTINKKIKSIRFSHILGVLLILCLYYSTVFTIPLRFIRYQKLLHSFKTTAVKQAKNQDIEEALIFIKVSWGNRLFSRLRGLDVPPSIIQKAYLKVDHCVLQNMLILAENEKWQSEKVSLQLEHLLQTEPEASKINLNKDPSLKLKKGSILSATCIDEIKYDRTEDYTIYTPSLTDNHPEIKPPFIVARDLRDKNKLLREKWPKLPAYIFDGKTFKPLS